MSGGERYAGVDLGGTKILVLVADAAGEVVGHVRIPTLAKEGPEATQSRIVAAVQDAAQEAGIEAKALRAIGVSAPGPIDTAAGVITDPPNLARLAQRAARSHPARPRRRADRTRERRQLLGGGGASIRRWQGLQQHDLHDHQHRHRRRHHHR